MQAPITALLLCNDAQSLKVIDRTFEEYSVSTYFCMDGKVAGVSANQRKFDLLMLDFDEPGSHELIDFRASDLWGYPSVVIAIASDPTAMKQALSKRAHFTLQKPFTAELMTNTLKAGYSLIVTEKRASFRHSVSIAANATFLQGQARRPVENATVHDISQNGLCLRSSTVLAKDMVVFVDFELPDTNVSMNIIGKIIWTNAQGNAGVQFRFVPPLELMLLRDWLGMRCPWDVELAPRRQGQPDLNAAGVPIWIQ